MYAHDTNGTRTGIEPEAAGEGATDLLGADTTLDTEFVATSQPVDGVLGGDLYMVGGGDPLLTTEAYQQRLERGRLPETDLEGVADQLVAAGVRPFPSWLSRQAPAQTGLYGQLN